MPTPAPKQLQLALRAHGPGGKPTSPTAVRNPLGPAELAAAMSARAVDVPAPAGPQVSPGQLALDLGTPRRVAASGEYQNLHRLADFWRENQERIPGPVTPAVMQARQEAFKAALQQVTSRPGEAYQMSLPGMNPTLMALRSREPMTPAEAQAAGIRAPWFRRPAPAGQQLEIDFTGRSSAANAVVPLPRPATQRAAATPGRMAGDQLARLLGLSLAGAAAGGAGLELAMAPGALGWSY